MRLLGRLPQRRVEPELMDQPGLDPVEHRAALRGLARINWLSGTARACWPWLRLLAQEQPGTPLRVLDVACGGGDVSRALWKRACKAGIPMILEGCDRSPLACAFATEAALRAGAEVRYFVRDFRELEASPATVDVALCCLFLHHLSDDQAVELLRLLQTVARRAVIISDLRRCRLGWLAAWAGTRLLTRNRLCHVDGPRSVDAAFTLDEARDLASHAGLPGAILQPCWPWRFVLVWRRP